MKTAICAIVKNEHKFIKEWVDYYLSCGFDAIYIFEDFDSKSHSYIFDKTYKDTLFIIPLNNNKLGINFYKNSHRQYELYFYFLQKAKVKEYNYDWVLFVDVDEFIMFEKGYDLNKLLIECKEYPAIWLCWKCYGANGYIKSPHPQLGVLEAYTKPSEKSCDIDRCWNIKSFVNVKLCEGFENLHEAKFGKLTNGNHYNEGLSYNKAWLNHYYTKSWEDYCNRVFIRGNFGNNSRSLDSFFKVNSDMISFEKSLIESVRHKHSPDLLFLSYKYNIISGGNLSKIEKLKNENF